MNHNELSTISLKSGRMFILVLSLLLATTLSALAQDEDIYLFGQTSFHYDQVWGPLEGDFFAEGTIDTTDALPNGVIAYENSDENGTTLLHVAASIMPDSTLDVFGFYLSSDEELQPGSYPIGASNLFFFMVGVDSFIVPEDVDSLEITDLLDLIQAEYKFISTSGSIVLTVVEDGVRNGEFFGSAIDLNQLPPVVIQVEDGEFELQRLPESVFSSTVPQQLDLSVWPNPFNPVAAIQLTLANPTNVTLEVFDMQGRLISRLHQGPLNAGRHEFQFEPVALSSGTYLIRAVTPTDQISRKVQYLK